MDAEKMMMQKRIDNFLMFNDFLLKRLDIVEKERDALKRECDFLIKYLTESNFLSCDICKHEPEDGGALNCERVRKIKGACFEWRGLPEDDDGR